MKGNCGSCDRPLRAGSVRRAWVLDADGKIASALVCSWCLKRAVAVVVPPPTTIAPACGFCGKEPAAVGLACIERLERHIKELTVANLALKATR